MNLDDLLTEWDKDSVIEKDAIGDASLTTGKLHAKYLRIYKQEKLRLIKLESDAKQLADLLFDYYSGNIHKEDLEKLGRDPYQYILKTQLERADKVQKDKQYVDLMTRIAIQKEKVDTLTEIMKLIGQRGFQVKNYLDWLRIERGYF